MPIAPYHISHPITSAILSHLSLTKEQASWKREIQRRTHLKQATFRESTFAEGNLFGDSEMQKLAEEAIRANNAPHRKGRKRSTLTEARPPLSAERMRELLAEIHEIETPTGIKYVNLRLTKRMVIGVRESSGKEFTINLDELYDAYLHCLRFTSPEVKRRIFMGHSPAVVLLKLLKEKASANP